MCVIERVFQITRDLEDAGGCGLPPAYVELCLDRCRACGVDDVQEDPVAGPAGRHIQFIRRLAYVERMVSCALPEKRHHPGDRPQIGFPVSLRGRDRIAFVIQRVPQKSASVRF